jgi:hydroxymethylglutaryl-CoA lyase
MAVKLTESPRDAMQGLGKIIPTKSKIDYINSLLKVGFDTIDFGSFVSPKAIPQLKDTAEVIEGLDMSDTKSKLLAIVGNVRGAETGADFEEISLLGFPHSISNRFLELNINSTIAKSRATVQELLELCDKHGKELMIYLSMAFGNPYEEEWSNEILCNEVEVLHSYGVKHVALSDTIGVGNDVAIGEAFGCLVPAFPELEITLHLHTTIKNWYEKLDAAYKNGCRGFDGVMNGLGGCPMAGHKLVGNIYTGFILEYLADQDEEIDLDREAFENSITKSITTFALMDMDVPEGYEVS